MFGLMISIVFCLIVAGCMGEDGDTDFQITSGDGGTETLRLAWDPPTDQDGGPERDVAGYVLYFGPGSGVYDVSIDAGLRTTLALSELLAEQPYFFAVTAYDEVGNESGFSNQVCAIPLPKAVGQCDE